MVHSPHWGTLGLPQQAEEHYFIEQCILKTNFKFIGKVESETNNWRKKFSSCSFYRYLFQKPIGSPIYMPNYSGKKNLEPNSWFK